MSLTVQSGDAPVDAAKLAEPCLRYGMGPASDVDIMVEFDPAARIGILKFGALAESPESLVGRKVALVAMRGLKPWVRPNIFKESRGVFAEKWLAGSILVSGVAATPIATTPDRLATASRLVCHAQPP